jgi:DeoR-like helix-turn-helix domain
VRKQSIPIPRPVLSEERCRHILEISNRDGRVLVGDLARQFRTPQVTFRKDLDALQAHGRIYRSHGGALPPECEKLFEKWVNIDKDKMLSRGEYLGDLYDIGFDRPSLTQSVKTDKCTTLLRTSLEWARGVTRSREPRLSSCGLCKPQRLRRSAWPPRPHSYGV